MLHHQMSCHLTPGTSKPPPDAEVADLLSGLLDEVAGIGSPQSLDSPRCSIASIAGDNTTTSSEAVTDQEVQDAVAVPVKRKRGRPPKNRDAASTSNPRKPRTPAKPRAPARRRKKDSDDENRPKRRRGGRNKKTSVGEKLPKTPVRRKKKASEDESLIPLAEASSKKRGRPRKSDSPTEIVNLNLTSTKQEDGKKSKGCLSQKVCKRPKRRDDSPDPFDDADEEFERVTKKMTTPRKRAIDAFHHGIVQTMYNPSKTFGSGLAIMPISLINKFHAGIPDVMIVDTYPNSSKVFKD